jgi:predicted dehydrogenase
VEILVPYAGGYAQRTHLEQWINRYELRVTAVIDASREQRAATAQLGGRDQTYIVELATMRVRWKRSFGAAADVDAAVDELERLASQ